MSMFKRIKSVFIVEDESYVPQKKNEVAANKAPTVSTPDIPVNENASASDRFVDSLLKAIEANNLEGFDYLEYKQSLRSLANMDMDEATRFNSAFAMAKTMGASKTVLLDSAKHYMDILQKEEQKFNEAYEKQRQKQVGSKEEKLKSLQASLIKKEEQIKKLQGEIKESKKQLEAKKKEIGVASSKVAETRDQFLASYRKVADQIQVDIERMNKFLNT